MMNGKHKKKSEKKIKKGSNREGVLRPSIYIKNKNLIQKRIPQVARAVNKSSNRSTFDNSRASRTRKQTRGIINWMHIANCVQHEMYPKLANIIRRIINGKDQKIGLYDVDNIDKMVHILKTERHLTVEETNFLYKLYERAMKFTIMTTDSYQAHKEYISMNDLDQTHKGLNYNILQDIYDVHRQFIFSNYHFEEYSLQQFRKDIIKAGDQYLGTQFVKKCVLNIQFKQRMNFHSNYIINDNIFRINNYIFSVSEYIHYLRNNLNNLNVKALIIPKSVHCVFNDSILYHCTITDVDGYLHTKNIRDYQRCTLRLDTNHNDIIAIMKQQYDIKDIINEGIKNLIMLIDRRHINCSKDILYLFPSSQKNQFSELYTNYLFGLDFNIMPATNNYGNVVCAYLLYGMGEKLRFFPETLTSLIPRIFKKPNDISEAELLDKIYAHEYKHGWKVDLNDNIFNKYYKILTGYTHVSLNNDRHFLYGEYSSIKEILFFQDLLQYEMRSSNINHNITNEIYQWFIDEEYDSESIVDDIIFETTETQINSNLKNYLMSNNQQHYFQKMRNIIEKYTRPSKKQSPQVCNATNVFDVYECVDVNYLINKLKIFEMDGFIVDMNKYNISDLLGSYDHIIGVHSFCKDDENENKIDLVQYITDEIGYCTSNDCPVLQRHRTRIREREHEQNISDNSDDNLKEIVTATLNALHCYILHEKNHLFRLEKSNNNIHFITPKNDESVDKQEEKSTHDSAISIKFGISVLKWLSYSDKPKFSSLKNEIVNNNKSTINEQMYLIYAQECFIKMINRKWEQYTLEELISVKIYTDTNSYQSALRKSFWKSSSKTVKTSFYQWALQLYKTALFHARPTPRLTIESKGPRLLYHGLNTVFVLDNALPAYNGPLSASLELTVAHSFSNATGLLWTIHPSYANKFKFVIGICVDWISQHKNEAEVLLINQYLPIAGTVNFDNNINNNVDHLLYSLKLYKKIINKPKIFYRIIGLQYDPKWLPIIESHKQFLYQPTVIKSKSLLERLVEELNIIICMPQYELLKSKLNVEVYSVFNYYAIKMKSYEIYSNNIKCKIIENNLKKSAVKISYNNFLQSSFEKKITSISAPKSLTISIKEKTLFECNNYIKLQDIDVSIFSQCSNAFWNQLVMEYNKLIVIKNVNSIHEQYHKDLLNSKYTLVFNEDIQDKIKAQRIKHSKQHIYQFNNVQNMHFIIPYKTNLKKVGVYVQFKEKHNFVLFKMFYVEDICYEDTIQNQVDYLLNLLKVYNYPIINSKLFFGQINIDINMITQEKHLSILKDHPLLNNSDSNKKIVHTLVEHLKIYQLSNILQKQQEKEISNRDMLMELADNLNITVEQLKALLTAQTKKINKEADGYKLGQTISLLHGYKGIIKYIGKTEFSDGIKLFGIKLNEWSPNANNGTVDNIRYFKTNPGYGYFARTIDIIGDEDDSKRHIVPVFVNDMVQTIDGYCGIVRFKGKTGFSKYPMIGIELDEWIANGNNGIINKRKYFECEDGYGYFVKSMGIKDKVKTNQKVDLNTLLSSQEKNIKRYQHAVHHSDELQSANVSKVFSTDELLKQNDNVGIVLSELLGPLQKQISHWQQLQQRETMFNDTKTIRNMLSSNNLDRTNSNDIDENDIDDEEFELIHDTPSLGQHQSLAEMLMPLTPKINSWQSLDQRQTLYNDTKAIRKLLSEHQIPETQSIDGDEDELHW